MTILDYKLKMDNSREAGVTLLLAIMVMAGLTLISLAIGSFAIQELRSSRAASVTEPAIGAAESGGEQSLWAIKRSGNLPLCNAPSTQALSNNSLISSCKSTGAATFNVKAGVPTTFILSDPNDPNGDVDLSGYAYNNIIISYISGANSINISAQRLDGTTTAISPASSSVDSTVNPTQNITIGAVAIGTEGRIEVTLTSTSDATVSADTSPNGMPNYPTLDSLGCSSKVVVANCDSTNQEIYSRRINITVPQ